MQVVRAQDLSTPHPRRVVVVGSGYAGMTAAVSLAHKAKPSDNIEIVLVSPLPYQESLSELDLVAAGNPRPQWAELWHGDIFGRLPVRIVYSKLDRVDPVRRIIVLGADGTPQGEISYWRLVLATGAIPSVPPVPGLRERGLTMWSVRDAHRIQENVEQQFKRAVTLVEDTECSNQMSVCVVGGGATGVEVVGTIADVWPRMASRLGYTGLKPTLTLLEGRPRILYDLPENQREKAVRKLEAMGVELVLGEMLQSVGECSVETSAGRTIPARVTIWCGGAKADPNAVRWCFETDNSGRLIVDDHYRIPSNPEVYAIGDIAAFRDPHDNHVIPMLAQFAIHSGAYVAKSLLAEVRGRTVPPFEPHMHGEFVSIGPRWGVGWMFGIPVSGRFAIIMKRITYILYWLQVGTFRLAWRRTRQMLSMHRY